MPEPLARVWPRGAPLALTAVPVDCSRSPLLPPHRPALFTSVSQTEARTLGCRTQDQVRALTLLERVCLCISNQPHFPVGEELGQ